MDTLFIPGWLITGRNRSSSCIDLAWSKGMSTLNPTKSWSLQVFENNVTYVGKLAL